MEKGLHLLAANQEKQGMHDVRKGFELLRVHCPPDEITDNADPILESLEYLKHNGGTYVDYLLNLTPMQDIETLMDEGRWDEVDRIVEQSNAGLLEAMGMIALRTGQPQVTVLADRISTLKQFLGFIDKITQDPFFYEQIILVQLSFKEIMHKFIFKFKDVDEDLIEDIYMSLFDFYHFLAEQDIIEASDVDEFKKEVLGMKKDLVATMHRYNAIRHDPTLDQEQMESLREEIFEGDHFWPFID